MVVVILLLLFISFVIFILLLFFISFPGYFTMPLALNPGFSGPWRPPPALTSTLTTFDCLFFFIYPIYDSFEWAFFTHRRFLPLCSFPTFLAQPVFIKASLGAGSSSLKFAGLYTDPWNTALAHLFVWFTVILNPLYILNLYLYMSILQKLYLWSKLWLKKYFFQVQFLRIRLLSR